MLITREEAEKLPEQSLGRLLWKSTVLAVVLFGFIAGVMNLFA